LETVTAGAAAVAIEARLTRSPQDDPNIAFLQRFVAARLYFDEILRAVVPMTGWWHSPRTQQELSLFFDPDVGPAKLNRAIDHILDVAKEWSGTFRRLERDRSSALDRYIAGAGLILWASRQRSPRLGRLPAELALADALRKAPVQAIADLLIDLFEQIKALGPAGTLVFQISTNRTASTAIARSVPAVKGDAARTLFAVSGQDIVWAVVDSGIDCSHPAFLDTAGRECRVRKSFDFTQFRQIASLGNTRPAIQRKNLQSLRETRLALPVAAEEMLLALAEDARAGREINWRLVEAMVALMGDEPPQSEHGTHVAGIIGANRTGAAKAALLLGEMPPYGYEDGMCPDIDLYDFRVLAPNVQDTEFALIAALQYIRNLNDRHHRMVIHGVNLSLVAVHSCERPRG
jgi:serine protease AprX